MVIQQSSPSPRELCFSLNRTAQLQTTSLQSVNAPRNQTIFLLRCDPCLCQHSNADLYIPVPYPCYNLASCTPCTEKCEIFNSFRFLSLASRTSKISEAHSFVSFLLPTSFGTKLLLVFQVYLSTYVLNTLLTWLGHSSSSQMKHLFIR